MPTDIETARRIAQFKFSIGLFERNYAELDALLQYLEAPAIALNLISPEEQWRRHIAMREIEFRLHNYVASAHSLIDHTRVLYQQLYEAGGLFPDYSAEVTTRFALNPLAQFVVNLRNMTQHYRLPNIQYQTHLEPATSALTARGQLLLLAADLRQWHRWNSPALELPSRSTTYAHRRGRASRGIPEGNRFFTDFRSSRNTSMPTSVTLLNMPG